MSAMNDFFGNLFDPTDKASAAAANAALSSTLAPGSTYWNQGNIGDKDAGILQGAAALQNSNIAANTANVDQDAAAQAALANLYGNIAANGGQMTEAVKAQAASDLANTASSKLNVADRAQAANVLETDSSERNSAAQGANANRAKVLANELQKQVWRTAVNHANFEASLAGKGIQNADYNLTGQLALAKAQGAQDAHFGQVSSDRAASATNFANTMAGLQAVGGALGQVASTGADMYAADKAATQGVDSSTKADMYSATPSQTTYVGSNGKSGGYALSGITPSSKYVNPMTGNTVDPNLPTDTSSWGDWLTGTSLVA